METAPASKSEEAYREELEGRAVQWLSLLEPVWPMLLSLHLGLGFDFVLGVFIVVFSETGSHCITLANLELTM